VTDPAEKTFQIELTESQLNLIISALSWIEKRQLYLEVLARNHGRDKEALARRESATATVALSEKLYAIGAKEAQ
jgi:hypothetical protein